MAHLSEKIGLFLFATDMVSDVRDVAKAAEEAGFESLFLPDHSHIPVSRSTPYRRGGDLPDQYIRTFDPFIGCTAAACVTEKLKLGTAICVVPERDPIILAKEASTLDTISKGRFLFGVGTGWNKEELQDHGIVFSERFDVTENRLGMMHALWNEEVATYDSPYAKLQPSWQWPKPYQQKLPILVGGDGPKSMKMAIKYEGEWFPMTTEEPMQQRIAHMASLAEEAGKPVPPTTLLARLDETVDLDAMDKEGLDRAVFMLPPRGDTVAAVREMAERLGLKG